MSSLKEKIALNIFNLLDKKYNNEKLKNLTNSLFFIPVNKRKNEIHNISLNINNCDDNDFLDVDKYQIKNHNDNFISHVAKDDIYLNFQLNKSKFVKYILSDIKMSKTIYNNRLQNFNSNLKDIYGLKGLDENSKIVVEFSSPNIAKPFHVGHLRSTIIGQFISNLLAAFNHKVIRINYLGDWGYQFALLAIGLKKQNLHTNLQIVTLKDLLEIYIKTNRENINDASVNLEAKLFLHKLENGEDEALSIWKFCRDLSVQENNKIYERLNINFDFIHSESMYYNKINNSIEKLENHLYNESENGSLYVDLTLKDDASKVYAVLKSSDGTSLYLSRDIEAALERINKLSANKLFYIVENGQHLHFTHLSRILDILGVEMNGELHVKFGHIQNMSTRSGTSVYLNNLLDKARLLAREAIISKTTTKIEGENIEECAEILGQSCILVNDLKRRRLSNYKFDWAEALNFNGNSGIFLQYTNVRLESLLMKFPFDNDLKNVDYDLLNEKIALILVQHMARYEEILIKCYYELEACHLVNYLFNLCRIINVAYKELEMQNQHPDLAKIRHLLFLQSKIILCDGLKLLGIKPLNKM